MIEYVQESYIAHEARQWRVRHDWGLGMGGEGGGGGGGRERGGGGGIERGREKGGIG